MANVIDLDGYKRKKQARLKENLSRLERVLAELGKCIEEMEKEEQETGVISGELVEKSARVAMEMITVAAEADRARGKEPLIDFV